MPARTTLLVNNEVYHVLNRGNGSIPIFKSKRDYQKFVEIFLYYRHTYPPLKLSRLNNLLREDRTGLLKELMSKQDYLVEIIAYCLMPNHIHFLIKQIKENGVMQFMRLSSDSYSRHFNTKYERKGSLFEGRFKAVRIENNEQLLHVSRYIHLNPYTSFLVKDFWHLQTYPYSSLSEYLGLTTEDIYKKEIILNNFKGTENYKNFILDQAEYQRSLELIKHQLLE